MDTRGGVRLEYGLRVYDPTKRKPRRKNPFRTKPRAPGKRGNNEKMTIPDILDELRKGLGKDKYETIKSHFYDRNMLSERQLELILESMYSAIDSGMYKDYRSLFEGTFKILNEKEQKQEELVKPLEKPLENFNKNEEEIDDIEPDFQE